MTTFKEVAHLYVGCKVQWLNRKNGRLIIGKFNFLSANFMFSTTFKPILFRLRDITKEQMLQLLSIEGFAETSQVSKTNEGIVCWYYRKPFGLEFNKLSPQSFAYLLSNHFDLFGLIDSGEAIDAKTLDPNPYK